MARSQDATSSRCAVPTAVHARPHMELPRSRISSHDSRPTLICGRRRAAPINLQFEALAKIGSSFPFELSNVAGSFDVGGWLWVLGATRSTLSKYDRESCGSAGRTFERVVESVSCQ